MRVTWTIAVDLDGVLCHQTSPDKYPVAKPIEDNIQKVNALYNKGFTIIIHTGRSWGMYEITKKWLDRNHVLYSDLAMGKVQAHFYIDDRNSTLEEVTQRFSGGDYEPVHEL